MKTVYFFSDVPKQLIKLVSEIRFDRVAPEQGRLHLQELDQLVITKTPITRRTTAGPAKEWTVPDGVPQEVVDFINGYDYSKIGAMQITMFTPIARTFLKGKGLI